MSKKKVTASRRPLSTRLGHDDKEQSRGFIEKAREIGADEDKSAADELLGRLAKTPPEPRNKQK